MLSYVIIGSMFGNLGNQVSWYDEKTFYMIPSSSDKSRELLMFHMTNKYHFRRENIEIYENTKNQIVKPFKNTGMKTSKLNINIVKKYRLFRKHNLQTYDKIYRQFMWIVNYMYKELVSHEHTNEIHISIFQGNLLNNPIENRRE